MDIIFAIVLLVICYCTGSIIEKNHYNNIKKREVKLFKSPFITFSKHVNSSRKVRNCGLVCSSVVIGCDNFKSFLAALLNLFGGNISVYESVLDRGRREAILRIREKAYAKNADIVMNIKLETVMLSPFGTRGQPKVCVTAYGTAVKYE